MAAKNRARVEGLRELGAAFKELAADVQRRVARQATAAGAEVIKDLAVRKVPVSSPIDTPGIPPGGSLRDLIYIRRQKHTRLTSQHVVTIRNRGKKVPKDKRPYQIGVYNEFGTVQMSPQPFMRPAFDGGKQTATEAIRARLKARIDKANKKVQKRARAR